MNRKLTGAMLALTVATLFIAGKAMADHAKKEDAGKVKCSGANSCKGKGACKGSGNECAGKNGCKGKGWTWSKSADECTKAGGKVVADMPKK